MDVSLELLDPLSIGDPLREDVIARMRRRSQSTGEDDEFLVDIPVTRDPFGKPVVRGTSLAGALREHLANHGLAGARSVSTASIDSRGQDGSTGSRPANLADLVCGSEPEELASDEGAGEPYRPTRALAPSALRVVSVDIASGELDDGTVRTAVNRRRGAAEPSKLFRRARVSGVKLQVLLQIDLVQLEARCESLQVTDPSQSGTPAQVALLAVDDLITATLQWQPVLGGMRTSGHGQARVIEVRAGIADPLGLDRILSATSTPDLVRGVTAGTARQKPLVLTTLDAPTGQTWQVDIELRATDPLLISPPKRHDCNESTSLDTVAASTWKGVLRSRCEFILRTCGVSVCESSTATCGECPTCELFGSASDDAAGSGTIGLIRFVDSPIRGEQMRIDHAPIDRFTGGAADAKLFSRIAWQPGALVTLSMRQARQRHPVPDWGRHLIGLAIRDLSDGLIGLGNSTTRGYGSVTTTTALPEAPTDWLALVPRVTARTATTTADSEPPEGQA
ncbi:MAG: RAMP superfamily CRISPR-associated protein [Micrococcales bacterium]|nr:RAMP superfamily CRISPR-associated protein [Micrococcales bacterium]